MLALGRVLVAFIVLLVQSADGLAMCACPTAAPSMGSSKAPTTCPMGMKTCCACCLKGPRATPVKQTRCPAGCKITTASPAHPATIHYVATNFDFAILPEQRSVIAPIRLEGSQATPLHLAVPRIRPPNARQHGLRA